MMAIAAAIALWIVVALFHVVTDDTGTEAMVLSHISLSKDGDCTILTDEKGKAIRFRGVYQLPTGSQLTVHWRRHIWQDDRWIDYVEGRDVFSAEEVQYFDGEPSTTIVHADDGRTFRYRGLKPIPIGKRVTVIWSASPGNDPVIKFVEQ
jgi:hypothetical protein